MENSNSSSSSSGIGVFGLLGIVFVVLKLTNIIAWSWWLVLLPFYGGFFMVGFFVLLVALIFGRH